ncbi:hypothetical protein BGW39_007701 [Mortierella sp. 14UC]|nr:hypothetical protein BGW39_007701 [Mortierella sp. 14UC]
MSPFDLPELRHRISLFVPVNDALSCALVSSSWTDDFLSALWFKIDFDVHPRFADLAPDIIAKHGNFIKVVRNAKTADQVASLDNAGVNSLREIRIETGISATLHAQAYAIVARNNTSLEYIYLFAHSPHWRQDSELHSVNVQALIPSSSGTTTGKTSPVKTLRLRNLYLTHEGLVSILQACSRLVELRLSHTDVLGALVPSYQHMGVTTFGSSFKSLFKSYSTSPSLLSYFPHLTTLSTFNYHAGRTGPSSDRIKRETSLHCPQLTGYYLEDDTGIITPRFLTKVADNNVVQVVRFQYEHMSMDLITAILLHRASLKNLEHFNLHTDFDLDKDVVVPVNDHFRESSKLLQLIPRGCTKLVSVDLHLHEMDMDEVEQGEWVCKDLETIYVRFRGLDTKEKILKAITLWRAGCWRRWQEKAGTPIGAEGKLDETDMSIEARVARHLVKFDKLWWVWLGYQTWTPV